MLREVQKNTYQHRKRKRKKIFFVFFFLALIAVLFFVCFHIKKIEVAGCSYYTEEQIIKKIIRDRLDYNSILLLLRNKYREKPVIPFIQDYDIELVSRNTVSIRVYEKIMTGCVEYMGRILYFDKDGIIVESSMERIEDVPVIVGLKYDKLVLNKKIEIQNDDLFQTILNITRLIRKYKVAIEKISFDFNNEVTLVSGNIRIPLGKRDVYDEQIANLANILPEIIKLNKPGVLDMTNYKLDARVIFREDKE